MMLLSDCEKHELYLKHKGIVFDVANRHRYLDKEIEDIRGWGFIGFVEAINYYEKNPQISFQAIAYGRVRMEILKNYRKRRSENKNISLQEEIFTGKDGSGKTLEEYIPHDNQLTYDDKDIVKMINEAIFEESAKNKNVVMDYLIAGKDIGQIAQEHGIPRQQVNKIQRQGMALIKRYLVNNDIIFDHLMHP